MKKVLTKILNAFDEYSRYVKTLNYLISLAALFYVFKFIFDTSYEFRFSISYIIPIFVFLLGLTIFSIGWSLLINQGTTNLHDVGIWMKSNIGKYLPFKVGVPILRASAERDDENSKEVKDILIKTLSEQFMILSCSSIVGILYFVNNAQIQKTLFYILIPLSVLVFYLCRNKNKYLKSGSFFFLGQIVLVLGILLLFNIIYGYLDINFVLGYMLITSVSMLFIGAPAGLGIREFLGLTLLIGDLDKVYVVEFLLIVRVLLVISDILLFFIGGKINRLQK